MYAYLNNIGNTVVSSELPAEIEDYIEFEEFPASGGVPQIVDGELRFVQPNADSENEETEKSVYDEMAAAYQEGVQEA